MSKIINIFTKKEMVMEEENMKEGLSFKSLENFLNENLIDKENRMYKFSSKESKTMISLAFSEIERFRNRNNTKISMFQEESIGNLFNLLMKNYYCNIKYEDIDNEQKRLFIRLINEIDNK